MQEKILEHINLYKLNSELKDNLSISCSPVIIFPQPPEEVFFLLTLKDSLTKDLRTGLPHFAS